MSKCRTTHHLACDCREAMFAEMQKRVEELEAREKKLVEALQFYADRKNWRYTNNGDVGAFDAWLDFKPDHYCKESFELGGFHARQALSALKTKLTSASQPTR